MENFRKRTKENPQAIDSILNAPTRSTHGPHKPTLGVEAFKRPNGFYANARTDTLARAIPGESTSPQQGGSILHMTLPGGALDGAKKKAKKDGAPKSKWRSIRKWTLRSGLVLGAFVILIGGYLAAKGYFKLHSVFKGGGNAPALQDNVSPELLKGEGDGRINILLLGRGGIGHDGPDLTDTILVASIDPVNKTAALVSLPRDFWVTTGSSSTKVNSVYANAKYKALNTNPKDKAKAEAAGIEAIKKKVSEVFDIPLHYYAMIDFKAFQQAIDTVGGVTIDVPEAVVDYSMAWENKGNPVLAKKGVQTFDGYHALMYVRSRHGSARGDFDRAERQRLLISAVGQKILSAGTYTNPVKISQLLDALGEHVSTDLSISDTLRLMKIAKGIPGTAIASVGLADPPHVLVTTGMISGQSVVRPLAGIGEFGDIQAYVRTKLQDGYILKEKAGIQLLNGSGMSGWATTQSNLLKSYGYNVLKVGDAPTQTYNKTVVVDLTKGKKPYTKNYLERRYGVQAVTSLPDQAILPEQADFVVILGSDQTSTQ